MNLLAWFDAPANLWALAAAPVVWLGGRAAVRAAERRRVRVLGRACPARPAAGAVLWSVLAFVAAVLALARPRFGEPTVPLAARGVDAIVCLDASRSMLARDAGGARIDAARAQLAALARSGRVGRMALVAFAGEARTVAPPTRDLGAVLELTREVGPDLDLVGGSDLAAALVEAEAVLARLSEVDGGEGSTVARDGVAIVLVTDGEDHGGAARAVAERLAATGASLHVLGVGSEFGAKIPLDGGTRFLTDAAGREVVTALDAQSLAALASATPNGSLRRVTAPDDAAADDLARVELAALEARVDEAERRRERPQRFQWFAGASLVALLVAARRRR